MVPQAAVAGINARKMNRLRAPDWPDARRV